MKIARIESFILGTGGSKELLFCRVETEDGTHGWGEAYVTAGKETVIAECVRAMAPYVIGRGVFNIRHTGQVMFEDFAIRRGSMELLSAWSAIEIASWDIIGKICGQPVYNLLGGAVARAGQHLREWLGRPLDDRGRGRARPQDQGDGVYGREVRPVPGTWRSYVDRRDEDFAIDYVSAMREALGPDFEILVEAHRRFAPQHAIRIGNRLAEFNIDWYEEPCLADNIALFAEVRRAVPIPSLPARRFIQRSSSPAAWRRARRTSSTPTSARSAASRR